MLNDPENPLVFFILFIHSLETFLYDVLHRSMIKKDMTKCTNLGPFAKVLGKILVGQSA
jgi:hypothetical protein